MIELDLDTNGDARVPVKDLIGQALDFWVCLCLGQKVSDIQAVTAPTPYSSSWIMGGPLLHMHNIAVAPLEPDFVNWVGVWHRPKKASSLILPQSVQSGAPKLGAQGPTPLVAGMRAFVYGVGGNPGVLLPAAFHEIYKAEYAALVDTPAVHVSH